VACLQSDVINFNDLETLIALVCIRLHTHRGEIAHRDAQSVQPSTQ